MRPLRFVITLCSLALSLAHSAWAGRPVDLVRTALAQRGIRYRWGGTSRRGFDCSGLTQYVYRKAAGIRLPRTARAQFERGRRVARGAFRTGDLLFFRTKRGIGHVGMYLGRGRFIHAPHPGARVRVQALTGWYLKRIAGARRVLRAPTIP